MIQTESVRVLPTSHFRMLPCRAISHSLLHIPSHGSTLLPAGYFHCFRLLMFVLTTGNDARCSMAGTPVMNNLSRWVARACPKLFATLISTFATCWGTVVGLEGPTPSLEETPKQIPINLCKDLGLTAEPCPENGSVQVVRRALFELRRLFSCTLWRCSTCWSISSSEDDNRPFQFNHSQNGPLWERT